MRLAVTILTVLLLKACTPSELLSALHTNSNHNLRLTTPPQLTKAPTDIKQTETVNLNSQTTVIVGSVYDSDFKALDDVSVTAEFGELHSSEKDHNNLIINTVKTTSNHYILKNIPLKKLIRLKASKDGYCEQIKTVLPIDDIKDVVLVDFGRQNDKQERLWQEFIKLIF